MKIKISKNTSRIIKGWGKRTLLGLGVYILGGILFTYPVANAAPGQLLNQWKFDETVAGSTAVDSLGNNDAIPTNDPLPSTDVAPVTFTNPRSASFDGTNYFTINRPASTDFSICAWVKTMSTGGGVDHWTSAPIMDSETGGVDYDFGFGVGNGGRLMFGNGGDDVNGGGLFDAQVNGTTPINDNTWHNVCVTRNNTTGEVNLYVDAALDGTGITGIGALTSNAYARIGYGYDGAALFMGNIDDVRVYDTVLTPHQLQVLTDGGNNPINVLISFDEQGGSQTSDMPNMQPGDAITLAAAPTKSGFTFLGWNTMPDGSGTMYAAGASYTVPGNDTTLYASYAPIVAGVPNTGIMPWSLPLIALSATTGLIISSYVTIRLWRTLRQRA